jgi:hypothetical protein
LPLRIVPNAPLLLQTRDERRILGRAGAYRQRAKELRELADYTRDESRRIGGGKLPVRVQFQPSLPALTSLVRALNYPSGSLPIGWTSKGKQ